MKTKVYHEISYSELEDIVNKAFPLADYEFVAAEELSSGVNKSYSGITVEQAIKSNLELDEVRTLLENGKQPMWRGYFVLLLLVQQGLLPEGNYLVEVSW